VNPQVPRDLETVCLKCLHKVPARRYASAAEVAAEMVRFLAGQPVQARPVGRTEFAWRWCQRNPVVAGLLTLVLLSLVAGTSVSMLFALRASEKADQANEQWEKAEDLAEERASALKEVDRARRRALKLAQERTSALKMVEAEKKKVEVELAKAQFVAYAFRLREAQMEIQRGRPLDAASVLRVSHPAFRG